MQTLMSVLLVLMNVNKFAITLMAATSACVIQAMCCQEIDTVVMVHERISFFIINFSSYIIMIIIIISNIMITLTFIQAILYTCRY